MKKTNLKNLKGKIVRFIKSLGLLIIICANMVLVIDLNTNEEKVIEPCEFNFVEETLIEPAHFDFK